jgi:hypothetical protein
VSVQAITWVLEHSQARYGARLVLLSIANHADREGKGAFPSITTIALEARMTPRQVRRTLPQLVDLGELVIEDESHESGTHRYTMTMGSRGGDNMSSPPDKLSPPDPGHLRPEGVTSAPGGGDISDSQGGTSAPAEVSQMSPEPSVEPEAEPSGTVPEPNAQTPSGRDETKAPRNPNETQAYCLRRLQDLDESWKRLTWAAVNRLNGIYGRPVVTTALQLAYEERRQGTLDLASGPYPLIEAICRRLRKEHEEMERHPDETLEEVAGG